MIYGYIRVSTDKQTTENQRFELLKYADEKKLAIDRWIEETVSSTRRLTDRKLGSLIGEMQKGDTLLVSELSRLGRSLMEVMSILHTLMEKRVLVYTAKERYELGNNINSKVLAFAFSLSAEIERSMISSRTTEALARRKSEGKRLGRPKGSLTRKTKLSGKEELIREYLGKGIPHSVIAKLLDVNRLTLRRFIVSRKLLN
ncbi:MAG: master DNA invertase Mpi family serine-type recombinase [Acidobacteria bacterium]|nr:master DNA invertase Mpi family serine-type recombinase [Acidobacteriota bacterium]MBV9480979.1 master DNA invertase Mpi family serine-type recombinase [Acidobacteriota bacterium]